MNDNLKIGLFGEAIRLQSKYTRITAFGTIKELEPKFVLFVDNDGFPYLLNRKEFNFIPREFKDLSKKHKE
jgi:hypothetical protein